MGAPDSEILFIEMATLKFYDWLIAKHALTVLVNWVLVVIDVGVDVDTKTHGGSDWWLSGLKGLR